MKLIFADKTIAEGSSEDLAVFYSHLLTSDCDTTSEIIRDYAVELANSVYSSFHS